MKAIYNDLLERLQTLITDETLRWIDWDKGQLKRKDDTGRYALAYPCALVKIDVAATANLTDTAQLCTAAITFTLAFDPLSYGRTAANAPDTVRQQGLEPYEVIAKVYAALQGYSTQHFDTLRRRSQGEAAHPDLFCYQIIFDAEFEDDTAGQ